MILRENVARSENTRCRPRTCTDWVRRVEWIDRRVLALAKPADVRGTSYHRSHVRSSFAENVDGVNDESRSYLPGWTGNTATLIRAPCNGRLMKFSSPLATLSFQHACAPISRSSFRLSLPRRAIRQPADFPLSLRCDWRLHPYFRYADIARDSMQSYFVLLHSR